MQYSDYSLQCLLIAFLAWAIQTPLSVRGLISKVIQFVCRVVGAIAGFAAFFFVISTVSKDWGYGWYIAIPAGMVIVYGVSVVQWFAEGMIKMPEPKPSKGDEGYSPLKDK